MITSEGVRLLLVASEGAILHRGELSFSQRRYKKTSSREASRKFIRDFDAVSSREASLFGERRVEEEGSFKTAMKLQDFDKRSFCARWHFLDEGLDKVRRE